MSSPLLHCERLTKGEDVDYFIFSTGYSPLSNFNRSPFSVNGVKYLSVEQYIAVQRAWMFMDFDVAQKLLREVSPKKCYDTALKIGDHADWLRQRDRILIDGLRAKFSQCTTAWEKLHSTGKSRIVFATPFDNVLGSGFFLENVKNSDSTQWVGYNLLGEMLMRVRYELFGY